MPVAAVQLLQDTRISVYTDMYTCIIIRAVLRDISRINVISRRITIISRCLCSYRDYKAEIYGQNHMQRTNKTSTYIAIKFYFAITIISRYCCNYIAITKRIFTDKITAYITLFCTEE